MALIRRRLSQEAGMTLVELLVALTIGGVVMGATLGTFTQFEQTTATNQRLNDAQDQVRVGVASLSRELRNLASPTNQLPEAVVRAGPQDLVFQSVSSTQTRRVRYCYDASARRVWRQVQFEPFSLPTEGACPQVAWGSQRSAVENVVNGARPVFTYSSATLTSITEIAATLYVDVNEATEKPDETSLQTSVFLRNQNRSPVASFTADVSGTTAILNGSASQDPEGRALELYWYDAGVSENLCGPLPAGVPTTGCIGQGVVYNYTPSPGTRSIYLLVRDPGTLTDQAAAKPVCIPGVGVTCGAG
jgi:prepilin-type N-terminal cleavage/methylation domain-containing protein